MDSSFCEVCILDFETVSIQLKKVIEVGCIIIHSQTLEIIRTFNELCNPGSQYRTYTWATDIHNITYDMVRNKRPSNLVMNDLYEFIGNRPIIGHNVKFEMTCLGSELSLNISNYSICTLKLSSIFCQKLPNFPKTAKTNKNSYKLSNLNEYFRYSDDPIIQTLSNDECAQHRALYDCYITYLHLKKMIEMIETNYSKRYQEHIGMNHPSHNYFSFMYDVINPIQSFSKLLVKRKTIEQ